MFAGVFSADTRREFSLENSYVTKHLHQPPRFFIRRFTKY